MPRVLGPVPSDKWEKEVRRQLAKQLPADWFVICNVSWALQEDGRVRDGQADFVVLAPNLGMVVVEVKGTQSVCVGEDGIWRRRYKNREELLNESPPEQANRNLHTLVKVVKKELGLGENDQFPGLHAWVVAYPNGEVEFPASLYDKSTIVTKNRMHQLLGSIKGAMLAKGGEYIGRAFTADKASEAAKILTNQRFRVVTVDTELDAVEDAKHIDELTRQQFAALSGAFDLPRVAIIGPAGSGKTLLAIWKLAALLEEGKKAIYVCFNTALAQFLQSKYPDLAAAIASLDSFFRGLVNDRTDLPNDEDKRNYFENILPGMVMDKSAFLGEDDKYDAIIVDEGQDFGEGRIIALYCLLKDESSQWLFFADNKQDLFGKKTDNILGAEVVFRLYHNCRNTDRVNAATNKVCNDEVKPMPGVPKGDLPSITLCNRRDLMGPRAWELVRQLSPDGGAVILSPFKLENSCMATIRNAYGLELTQDIRKLGMKGYVYFSTIYSFKGLEASHVVFVDADKPGANQSLTEEAIYVAFTRATARLDIVTASPEAEAWFKLHISNVA